MAKRSKMVFSLGLAIVVAGAFLGYRTVKARTSPKGERVTVLSAASPIPAGTTGANAAGQGLVAVRAVSPSDKPANALTDVAQLAGKTAIEAIPAGTVLTLDRFPQAQTRIGTVLIPPEKIALALQMANVAGVAGFAGAGDKIDIFGVAKEGPEAPGVRLVMQNIEVLNVNGTVLAPSPGQPEGKGLVFLLAVSPAEAERLVYLTTFEQLYFSLVPRNQSPVRPTPGIAAESVLKAT